ncbi:MULTISPECIES: metallophosphoesterase [Rhodomicrobium]|uniref:metallophosphoesterase family protein n=1 Tax=Rhodomicrobium TaxID=1068 RepID=UPI0014838EC2|nr:MULTISPECIES: metallophosphoesterase [Rhodomicrobium]
MARIIALSDLHLSPTHGFFWENWRIARDFANRAGAEAIIVNGDLCINGPDSDAEMAFAATALGRLNGVVLALPGNHDVGDEPPGQDVRQIVDAERLARWTRAFGRDHFALEIGGWWLIGLDAQLFGSGLAEEAMQNRRLDEQLRGAGGRPVALFLHKPLFAEHPHEREATSATLQPVPRLELLARLARADVRLVVSGHLHQFRDRVIDGIRHLWLPAVAFRPTRPAGGDPRCGLAIIDFSDTGAKVQIEYPAGLVDHDLDAIKGHGRYRFLREMPPSPPPAELG